ncbi:MAG: glycosyltransferase [Clostridia bacterium]|nr:glycosyltransferase [Clostridia bacterium]
MKILEIISSLEPIGGGETFAVNLCRELSINHIVKVVVLYKNHNPYFDKRLKEKNIDVIFLSKKKHIDFKNFRELRKIIKSFRPDVIHTENNSLIPSYFSTFFPFGFKKPFVFHTMHLAPIDECSNTFVRLCYKHILKKKRFIPVAITESLSLESKKFYRRKYVPYIENGIDLEPFEKDNIIPITNRKYDVAVVARFTYQKNHEFLVKAFKELSKKIGNLKIAFIGSGELFDETVNLAKKLDVNFIDFKGALNGPSKIVRDSKIIALGSRFEANPLSILEGLSAGCIVVSTNVGGIANIVKKENGILVENGDFNSFVEAFIKILGNVDAFKEMSVYNATYGRRFSMKRCAEEYVGLFENAIED